VVSDESELVARVCQGDRRAYASLVARHLPAVEVYARRILGDEYLAQDVAQEVMLVLWQRLGRFNPKKSRLTTWLHRIAHNRCIDLLRKPGYKTLEDAPEPAVQPPTTQETFGAASIDAALFELPESQRTALVLTYYQNFTNREVALIMSSSVRAVESLLCRARGNLKKHLETDQ
jgi:RNA polymerase sigma-70 factor (ECF subfamily)